MAVPNVAISKKLLAALLSAVNPVDLPHGAKLEARKQFSSDPWLNGIIQSWFDSGHNCLGIDCTYMNCSAKQECIAVKQLSDAFDEKESGYSQRQLTGSHSNAQQPYVPAQNTRNQQSNMYTKQCTNMLNFGNCRYSRNCKFSHDIAFGQPQRQQQRQQQQYPQAHPISGDTPYGQRQQHQYPQSNASSGDDIVCGPNVGCRGIIHGGCSRPNCSFVERW